MATEWYLRSGSTVTGPLTTDQLKAMGKSGRVTDGMEVSKDASGPWHRAAGVNGLVVVPAASAAAASPPVVASAPPAVKHTTVLVDVPKPRHVTTEATGKGIKLQQLIALVMLLGGLGLFVAGVQSVGPANPAAAAADRGAGALMTLGGMLMFTVGVAWRIVLRVLKWWHHG
jgi:hypothetical protein